ncbi:MAG: MarR family winged helix-turn-helix transcriptional regulator [Kiloniellales bacterium]
MTKRKSERGGARAGAGAAGPHPGTAAAQPLNRPRSATPGPDLDLDRFLPYRISVLQLAVSRCLARIYGARFKLTRHEWRAVAVLGQEQPLTANGICTRTNMDKVQVSRAVAGLAAAKLVARRPDARDRRRGLLNLTPEGRAIYQEIVPLVLTRERELLAAFSSAEVRDFERLLGKLQAQTAELLAEES